MKPADQDPHCFNLHDEPMLVMKLHKWIKLEKSGVDIVW